MLAATRGALAARALGAFALFTTPIKTPAIENVVLQMTFDGASGGTVFTDEKGNQITTLGAVAHSSTQSFSNGVSGSFPGATGAYLRNVVAIPGLAFGTGNFCIEGRARFGALGGGGVARGLFQISPTAGALQVATTNTLGLSSRDADASWEAYGAGAAQASAAIPSTAAWYHFVLQRAGGTTQLYIDGVSVLSFADTTNYTGQHIAIGGIASTTNVHNGYLDELRICNTDLYPTGGWSKPVLPFGDLYFSYVKFLAHMEGADGAQNFPDVTGKVVTRNGNVTTQSAWKKQGISSALFGGTAADFIVLPASADFEFTADFTIEFTYRQISTGTNQCVMGAYTTNAASHWMLHTSGANNIPIWYINGTGLNTGGVGTYPAGTEVTIALVRTGTTCSMYVNGVLNGTPVTFTGAMGFATTPRIGLGATPGGVSPSNCYIDEVRITKGIARYLGNYTPRGSAFLDA